MKINLKHLSVRCNKNKRPRYFVYFLELCDKLQEWYFYLLHPLNIIQLLMQSQ